VALEVLSLFNLYRFTPGRRAWMSARIAEAATQVGLAEIATAATALIASEKELAADFRIWTTVRAATDAAVVSQKLVVSDQQRDAILGAFDAFLDALAGRSTRPAGQAAGRVQREVFPEGSRKIITLPYPDETAAIESMVQVLETQLVGDVTAAGAGDWVAELKTTNSDFATQYDQLSAGRQVDFKALRVRDEAQQATFLRLIGKVVGASTDDAQLGTLLDSVAVQQAAMKALYQSRRAVSDVDADTGVPLPQPVATDPPAPTP